MIQQFEILIKSNDFGAIMLGALLVGALAVIACGINAVRNEYKGEQ